MSLSETLTEFEIASQNALHTHAYAAGYYHSLIIRLSELVSEREITLLEQELQYQINKLSGSTGNG
jgi:hypothetical protein